MNNPLISIILTNYNGERFVRDAINSVLSQTYSNWELIIVDDCSTDNSPAIIGAYHDPRIHIHKNPRNVHVAQAHQIGNQLVHGEYVAILDNDDFWKPEKLETQLAWLESHPEYDACFAWPYFVDENGEVFSDNFFEKLFYVQNRSHTEWVHDLLTTGNHLCNDSVLMRTSVLRDVGNENICFLQLHDFHFWMRLALKHSFYILETPLVYCRRFRQSGSITDETPATTNRSDFEFCWIIGTTVLQMEPALFRRVFAAEMVHPEAESEEEIRCEKAFLLAGDKLHENCRFFAFSLFEEMFRDQHMTELLDRRYGFRQHDVYKMTGTPIVCSRRMMKKQNLLEKSYTELKASYDELWNTYQKTVRDVHEMQNSTSWKLTAPVRALMKLLRRG